MKLSKEFKQQILDKCRDLLLDRMKIAEQAMAAAQDAANSEEKSSAGDKYETSRAMNQLDRDMYARQFLQAKQELEQLNRIDFDKAHTLVEPGSLVLTDDKIYLVACGIGTISGFNTTSLIVISPASEFAKALFGKTVGEKFSWRNLTGNILQII